MDPIATARQLAQQTRRGLESLVRYLSDLPNHDPAGEARRSLAQAAETLGYLDEKLRDAQLEDEQPPPMVRPD